MGRTTIAIWGGTAALVAVVAGCNRTSSDGGGAVDGAAEAATVAADAEGDADVQPSTCAAAGGECILMGSAGCAELEVGFQDCEPAPAVCCIHRLCAADAGAIIQASDYDLTCTVDSDCIAVGFGNACVDCLGCTNGTINTASEAQYKADIARSPATGAACFCVSAPEPFSTTCCHLGQCQTSVACLNLVVAGDAAANPGDATAEGGASDAGVDAGPDAGAGASVEGGPADAGVE